MAPTTDPVVSSGGPVILENHGIHLPIFSWEGKAAMQSGAGGSLALHAAAKASGGYVAGQTESGPPLKMKKMFHIHLSITPVVHCRCVKQLRTQREASL